MDDLAHTLAGLALAEAGLERRTALGAATLVIGANLPDVDALAYAVGGWASVDVIVPRVRGVAARPVAP